MALRCRARLIQPACSRVLFVNWLFGDSVIRSIDEDFDELRGDEAVRMVIR